MPTVQLERASILGDNGKPAPPCESCGRPWWFRFVVAFPGDDGGWFFVCPECAELAR